MTAQNILWAGFVKQGSSNPSVFFIHEVSEIPQFSKARTQKMKSAQNILWAGFVKQGSSNPSVFFIHEVSEIPQFSKARTQKMKSICARSSTG